jgi:hypothetical protein
MPVLLIREVLLLRDVLSFEIVQTEEGNHFRVTKFQFIDKRTNYGLCYLWFCAYVVPTSECLEIICIWTVSADTPPITAHRPCLSSGEKLETKELFSSSLKTDGRIRTRYLERKRQLMKLATQKITDFTQTWVSAAWQSAVILAVQSGSETRIKFAVFLWYRDTVLCS